jgi:hypothetical protein
MIVAMLVHRLRLERLMDRHPEIRDERIAGPIIILGLPRSGTTALFNILARDSSLRFMANWEAFVSQVPPAGKYTFHTDPRRRQAKWVVRFIKYLMPGIDQQHVFDPAGPEECTPILMQGFATQAFVGNFDAPAYAAWLDRADRDPTYRHHRRALQALQWKYPGGRWVLKSPDHLAAVDSILKVYPDACLVHIHRDPVRSVSSWASLNLVYRSVIAARIDPRRLGRQVLDRLGADMDRYMNRRRSLPAGRFCDLAYEDFLKDPLEAVRGVYDHFGLSMSGQAERRMRAHVSANPRHKHGVHKYAPEDFGVSATLIRERFRAYISAYLADGGGRAAKVAAGRIRVAGTGM